MKLPSSIFFKYFIFLFLLFTFGHLKADVDSFPEELSLTQLSTDDLPDIRKRKYLRALVTYSPTDFTIMPNGKPAGLQADALVAFEDFLNQGIKKEINKVKVIFVPTTFDRLIPDLLEGKGDIAADFLTITPEREKVINFATKKVMRVDESIVVHKKIKDIKSVNDLSGKTVYVQRGSSYFEHLQEINQSFVEKGMKPILIKQADSNLITHDLLEMMDAGLIDITVADDYEAKLWSQVYKNIWVLDEVDVSRDNYVGWGVRKNNPLLQEKLMLFANKVKKGTYLGNVILHRYYKGTKWITNPISSAERAKYDKVISFFKKYAPKYNFDILEVIALAYQESQLDHSRRSKVGAIGVMQLMPFMENDERINIKNIHQIENNIHAGIKYLALIRKQNFSDPNIDEESRLAFTWASYNAGPNKVKRIRDRAKKMGLDPNVWFGNVEIAAARMVGNETVRYVRNIYKYYIAYKLLDEKNSLTQ